MLSMMPLKYISTMAKITLTGIETATIMVGLISRRKIRRMMIASTAPISRFCSTLLTMISM